MTGTPLAAGDLTIAIGDSEAFAIPGTGTDSSARAKAEAIDQANIPGLPTVSATNVQPLAFTAVTGATGTNAGAGTYSINLTIGTSTETITAAIGAPTGAAGSTADSLTASELTVAINDAGIEGLSAAENTTAGGITLTDSQGRNVTITSESKTVVTDTTVPTSSTTALGSTAGGLAITAVGSVGSAATMEGQISIEALDTITIGGNAPEKAGFQTGGETIAVTGSLETVDIRTVSGANDAIKRVDSALTTINSIRSELGAVQNRFESTIANLSTTSENLSAANSRIRDADFAKETAELARTQVLQQAGLSVLAQANARPQQVLQLLQG